MGMVTQPKAADAAQVRLRTVRRGPLSGWRTDLAGLAFSAPFLVAYGFFVLWPIILGLRMSFFNWSLLGTSRPIGFGNYSALFADPLFWDDLWHTAEFTLMSTPPLVVLALAMALLANRKVRMQWLFRLAFFAPYVLPVAIVYLVWNWLYQPDYGLINSVLSVFGIGSISWLSSPTAAMPAVVITTVWWTIGFNFILYLAGLQEIPQELYEAAAIDGASGWARLRYITIPLLQRTTTLIVILQVLASLKVFDQIYLLTGGGPDGATRSIIEYIYEQGFQSYRLGYAAAMSYVFFVLILIISVAQFVLFSRRKEGV
jgi:ABC-type sugar transport system permease subunit